jgi:hypothetical protein
MKGPSPLLNRSLQSHSLHFLKSVVRGKERRMEERKGKKERKKERKEVK